MSGQLPTNEFSRLFNLETIKKTGTKLDLIADKEECEKLAVRFSIPEVVYLKAVCQLQKMDEKEIGDYRLEVKMSAEVVQQCVLTLEYINESIEEEFCIIFKEISVEKANVEQNKEVDFELEEVDIEFISSLEVDLGEYVAEYLSLSINPYPRRPEVRAEELGYKLIDEDQGTLEVKKENPFSVLKDLKHKT